MQKYVLTSPKVCVPGSTGNEKAGTGTGFGTGYPVPVPGSTGGTGTRFPSLLALSPRGFSSFFLFCALFSFLPRVFLSCS
jgi:hypothetical protein